MRWSAIRAQCLSSSGTEIWFTTRPSARFSIAQHRWGASIRYIVEHWQTVGERKKIFLSGWRCLRRFTRFNSVPIPQTVPGSAAETVRMMNSVEPDRSA